MTWDALFSACSTLALAGWAVLILAPRRFFALPRWGIPVALSAVYAALVMAHFADAGGGFGSIAAVRALFASDPALVAGWVHYLAFDLLVGALVAARMDRAGVPRVVQAGPLAATFLLGPVGLLLGLMTEGATRALRRRMQEG
ncbi:MAG: abscisic acid-deficient protein Aba4 family protein [Gemmobacter sp.]